MVFVEGSTSTSPAARTNLTSFKVILNKGRLVGVGAFRYCYFGTFVGGNRNQQEAVCKCFKSEFRSLEDEFYEHDKHITDKAIDLAEGWNAMCEFGKEILITQGNVHELNGVKYIVEPMIRYFTKFTSNSGWIADVDDVGWSVLAMEAFSHYTYHRSGGQLIVCDLQGRYRNNRYNPKKSRFELTDVAICSRQRRYGPTDLGEKGIATFFANHRCNKFCNRNERWHRPKNPGRWFDSVSETSMMASNFSGFLSIKNRTRWDHPNLPPIQVFTDSDDDSW